MLLNAPGSLSPPGGAGWPRVRPAALAAQQGCDSACIFRDTTAAPERTTVIETDKNSCWQKTPHLEQPLFSSSHGWRPAPSAWPAPQTDQPLSFQRRRQKPYTEAWECQPGLHHCLVQPRSWRSLRLRQTKPPGACQLPWRGSRPLSVEGRCPAPPSRPDMTSGVAHHCTDKLNANPGRSPLGAIPTQHDHRTAPCPVF